MEYQARISSDQPIGPVDRVNKNPSLVEKINILAGAMNQITTEKKPERKRIPSKRELAIDGPEEQRVMIDELPKVLYLNNKEPKKVNNFKVEFLF